LLKLHIVFILSAYALFFAASVAGVTFLFQESLLKRQHALPRWTFIPSLDVLEAFVHQVILWAFPLLSVGLIFGALWAKREWGRYWGWDPKETFAFVTWLIYGVYLLIRHSGWRGRKSVYLALAGYVVVLVTWILVNGISPLHKF
jgi:ABC-type transport system involved in cytochrome c biogenesis permease subunit